LIVHHKKHVSFPRRHSSFEILRADKICGFNAETFCEFKPSTFGESYPSTIYEFISEPVGESYSAPTGESYSAPTRLAYGRHEDEEIRVWCERMADRERLKTYRQLYALGCRINRTDQEIEKLAKGRC
jgi:hypothetical protein